MNKRLYIITPWYNAFSGGAEVAARELAEQAVTRGIEVMVLTTCCKSPYDNWWENNLEQGEEVINGVTVKRFNVNTSFKELYQNTVSKQIQGVGLSEEDKYNFFKFGISSDTLIKYVQTINKSDLILALPYFQALSYNVIVNNPNRVSLIPCFHDEEQFYWTTTAEMIERSARLLFLSEPEKDMAIKEYGLKFKAKVIEADVIGLGVEISERAHGECDLSHFNLPSSYLLYVGRKDIGKGVGRIVQYHQSMSKKIPMVFIGGGDASLVPFEEGLFFDLGFVSEKEKYALIQNAKGVVNLSENESFSLVIMESWLMGTPVIVSERCAVTKYHCLNSEGGFAIGSMLDYENAADVLIRSEQQRDIMGKKGNAYVKKRYTWNKVIHHLLFDLNEERAL